MPENTNKTMDAGVTACGGSMEYICVRALEDGVSIIGMTRGKDTRLHHTEKLDKGEICVMQFTEHTSAIKVRGKARVYTKFGEIDAD